MTRLTMPKNGTFARYPFFLVALVALTLGGCATNTLHTADKIYAQASTTTKTNADASQQNLDIDQIETNIVAAERAHMPVLAPLHFQEAQAAVQRASMQKDAQQRQASLQAAELFLERGQQLANATQRHLAEPWQIYRHLLVNDAAVHYPERFQALENALKQLAMKIENKAVPAALAEKAMLRDDLIALEKDTQETSHQAKIDALYEAVYAVEADDYAPATFAKAIAHYNELSYLLEHRNRDTQAIQQRKQETMAALKQAVIIAEESRPLVGLNSAEAEQKILQMRAGLAQTTTAQQETGNKDEAHSPLSYEAMTHALHETIASLQSQLKDEKNKLAQLKKQQIEHHVRTYQGGQSSERFAPVDEGRIEHMGQLGEPPNANEATADEQAFDSVEIMQDADS